MRPTYLLCLLAVMACGDDNAALPGDPAEASPGTLRLVIAATGSDVDSSYTVGVQEGLEGIVRPMRPGVPEEFALTPGVHTISLRDVESNCRLVQGVPFAVQVPAGTTTDATLNVSCDGFAYILVTARPDSMLGPLSAARCRFSDCGTVTFSAGRALLRTTAGHWVVALPCAYEVPVVAVAGDTLRVDFPMLCDERPK